MLDNDGPVCLILLLFLIIIDIIVYGFQTALGVIDEKEIERRAKEDKTDKASKIRFFLDHPGRMTNLMMIVMTLNHVVMGCTALVYWVTRSIHSLSTKAAGSVFDTRIMGVSLLHIIVSVLGVVLFLYALASIGILLPRKLAGRKPEKWAYGCVGIVYVLYIIYKPLLYLTEITTKGILWILGDKNDEDLLDVTEEEIIDMVKEGHEQGVIEDNEAEMIHKIFEYGDKEAQDIMTNRSNIIAIDEDMNLEDALQFMLEENNSRYPVYHESIDHIVGILYLKDAMRFHNAEAPMDQAVGKIEGLLRKAEYTPLTRNIDDLFETLQSKKLQMAIVIDEYGQTAGLVTMEDILEEIVGKIQDEYDEDEGFIEETSSDSYCMEGMTPLQDIEEQLGISFGDTVFETLNGFIIGKMEHIPESDESFEFDYKGYNFKVLSIENMRVQSVLVKKLEEPPAEEQINNKEEN